MLQLPIKLEKPHSMVVLGPFCHQNTQRVSMILQSKFGTSLACIKNKLPDLKKDFEHLRSDLSITKLMNTNLNEKVLSLAWQT